MENAEERKKMKKIEKEEQLKKKLEQTTEEKMAADSKTVEGESAVVKAEEGNTATEQEAAPALSEEELNAMYERFQQRLQKEGLADAEGNPTEKTLEIRRQIVERKAEREKQAERQKKIAKRAKTTKHWVRTAKAAGVVLVVGACVFGASMTSEANRIRLVETISGVRNSGDTKWVDNGEDRKYTAEDWDKVKEEIQEFQAEVAHMDKEKAEAEFGDVMFSLINAARLYKINPDNALEQTNQKFINRFNYVEAHSIKEGKNLHDMTLEEMDKLWNEAKALEKESKQDDSSKGQV